MWLVHSREISSISVMSFLSRNVLFQVYLLRLVSSLFFFVVCFISSCLLSHQIFVIINFLRLGLFQSFKALWILLKHIIDSLPMNCMILILVLFCFSCIFSCVFFSIIKFTSQFLFFISYYYYIFLVLVIVIRLNNNNYQIVQ